MKSLVIHIACGTAAGSIAATLVVGAIVGMAWLLDTFGFVGGIACAVIVCGAASSVAVWAEKQ